MRIMTVAGALLALVLVAEAAAAPKPCRGRRCRPTLTLTATPATIEPGQPSTLAWSSTNVETCEATGAWSGAQPVVDEVMVLTATTATYTLTCDGAGGTIARSATITVIDSTPISATLTWDDNAGGTAFIKVERKTGAAGSYAQIATTEFGATEYIDTTLLAGMMYCYRVRAANAYGDSAYSNEACKAP